MKNRRYIVNVNHFQEAYKFLTQIRADKFTSIQIRRKLSSYAVNVLPIVPEEPSVSDPNADYKSYGLLLPDHHQTV